MSIVIRLGVGVVGTVLALVVAILVFGFVLFSEPAAGAGLGPDGTPLLLGQSRLSPEQLTGWWNRTGHTSRTTVDGPTLMRLYADAGAAHGIRADLAVAQAVLETGYFEHLPVGPGGINNYAGIAVYNGPNSGAGFATAADGVNAHVALLHEYADANYHGAPVHSGRPGCCQTVGSLTGIWATDPAYATSILAIYASMLASAGLPPDGPAPGAGGPIPISSGGPVALATTGGITVAASIAPQLHAMLQAAGGAGLRLSGGGYRDAAQQIALRKAHCGPSNYDIYEKPSNQCSPPTARPGQSMHEQGLAIDFQCNGRLITSSSNPCFQWLAANAANYGFFNLPSEYWHWSRNGS